MKARFTISNKLILGFGILMLTSILNGLFTYSTLNSNQKLNLEIITTYTPSVSNLQELYTMINNSQMLAKNWVFVEKQTDTPDKKKLQDFQDIDYPLLKSKIISLAEKWSETEKLELDTILNTIETKLFPLHKTIMDNLNSFTSYDDPMLLFEITPMVEEGGDVIETTQSLLKDINSLKQTMVARSDNANSQMAESFKWFQKFVIVALFILMIFVLIVGFITTRSIVLPVLKLKEFLITMTKGVLPKEKLITQNDEIGDMGDALNGYIENMRKTSEFAVEIGNGNFNSKFDALSEEDALGNALIDMRENLKKASDEANERAKADEIRNWITKGLANFGDILRQNSDNMDRLTKNIMTNLIDYLNVNQGAIYILNELEEEHPFLEMKSAIAYGREKFLKRNFEINEGLVGRCAFEKLPVYLKEIPENYIRITSGLGGAEPSNLLLVPLAINGLVLGVIELASFNEIPKYQIDFVSSLGENIASTISNVRINEQTKHLLQESKMRGDELSAQEEELRQNMEELQATQEEAARRENEMHQTIDAINNTMGTIEIDKHGNILSVNDSILKSMTVQANALIGKSFQLLFASTRAMENEFIEKWANLQVGESGSMISNVITQDGELWFKHTFTPFRTRAGELTKVIDLIIDITDQKKLEKDLESYKLNIN